MCRFCKHTRTSRGRFICNFIYLYDINAVLWKSFFENWTQTEGTTLGPSFIKDHHGDARLYVELVLLQVQFSQSWFPVFEVEAVPTSLCHLSFTPPQGLGRGWGPDGSWGPSSILNAASSPPPTTLLLHSWSYLHPLTPSSPSPIETPEPQRSSVLHEQANTVLHQNASHVAPLQLPWIARKSSRVKDSWSYTTAARASHHQNKGAAIKASIVA